MKIKTTKRADLLSLESGQFFKQYRILSNGLPDGTYAIPLGEGGSGIVYLAEQEFIPNIKVKRAIKFFVYADNISEMEIHKNSGGISKKNFNDEILNISSFNHENIIKIIDGGLEDKNAIPYIVTDYVEGHTLEHLINDHTLIGTYLSKGEDIIDLFVQICRGLHYLHDKKFYHCDIAPKNIFIKGGKSNFHVVIGDLGIGKTLTTERQTDRTNKVFVFGSKKYVPKQVYDLLNKEITFAEFCGLQPDWDIYGLQKTMNELIEAYEKLQNTASPWFNSLKKTINRQFSNVNEIAINIERQKPIFRQTAGIPELSEADSTSHGHKMLIPIKSVWITDRFKRIIRHPLFNRLKKVPQLLSADTFTPGSNHTRYEHSLGTFENMRQILIALLRKESFIELLDEENIEVALLASILSSITKFPFSFVIHEIKVRDPEMYTKISQKHVLNKIIHFKDASHGVETSLWETIAKDFKIKSLETLVDITSGETKKKLTKQTQIINRLLNSPIDAKVLDFLQRDSYHLGITNSPINFESLIDFIVIHNNGIAVTSQGVSYVEQVVTLRYWLYKRIYWNSPNRAYLSMFKYIFTKLYRQKPSFEDELLEKVLFFDPIDVLHFLNEQTENIPEFIALNRLLKNIFSDRPKIFKEIYVINSSEAGADFALVCKRINEMPFDSIEEMRMELEVELSKVLDFQSDTINVLIDIPIEDNKKLGEDLNVVKSDGTVIPITTLSGLINGIATTFDKNIQFLRIYLNPQYKDQLDTEKDKQVKHFVEKFLLSYFNN